MLWGVTGRNTFSVSGRNYIGVFTVLENGGKPEHTFVRYKSHVLESTINNATRLSTAEQNIANLQNSAVVNILMIWAQGGLSYSGVTDRTDRLHTDAYLDHRIERITADNGYVFGVAGYEAETWLGYLNSGGTFGGTSAWLTDYDFAALRNRYPSYRFRLVAAKADTASTIPVSDSAKFAAVMSTTTAIIDAIPHFDTAAQIAIVGSEMWKSNFGTVAVPQGICVAGDTLYASGQTQGGSDTAPSYVLKMPKRGGAVTVKRDDNFGHCSGITIDASRNIGYIAKWDAETNYSTLYKIDATTLEKIDTINLADTLSQYIGSEYAGFTSCAYNAKYDRLILAMRGAVHRFAVLRPDLTVERVFFYEEPDGEWALQDIDSRDDWILLSLCIGDFATGVQNEIRCFDFDGRLIFKADCPLADEIEGVAWDGVSMYATYNDTHRSGVYAPIYRMSYVPGSVPKADVQSRLVRNAR